MKKIKGTDELVDDLDQHGVVKAVRIDSPEAEVDFFEALPETAQWIDGTKAVEFQPTRDGECPPDGSYWILVTVDGFLGWSEHLYA